MERTAQITLPVTVEFSYVAATPAETGPDAQYPGSDAEIEIEAVYVNGTEIPLKDIPDDAMADLITDLHERIADDEWATHYSQQSGMLGYRRRA